jgi:hypothetical protein
MTDEYSDSEPVTITLGISIEPIALIEQQLASLRSKSNTGSLGTTPAPLTTITKPTPPTTLIAQRILKHLFNFLSSFTTPDGMIEVKAFQAWWEKFQARLNQDPSFLERAEDT